MNTKCFLKLDTTVGIRNLWTFSDVNQGFWPASRHLRYKQTLRSACFGAQTSATSTHKPHKSQDLQSPEELLEGLAQVVTIGKLQVSHPWILLYIYILYIYTVRHVYIIEPQSEPPNCTMHSMYIHIHTYHIYIYRYRDDTHGCEIDEGEHYKNTPGKLLSCKHSKLLKKGPWGRRSWQGCSGSPPNPRFGFARSLWWCD